MITLYLETVARCPGLPSTVLDAVGTVESDNDNPPSPASAPRPTRPPPKSSRE